MTDHPKPIARQYADRDIIALDRNGGHYLRHVQAMTEEGLHAKSDIAAELAFRDARIAELEREKVELFDAGTALKAELASIRAAIEAMAREWKEYGSRLLNDNHYATRAIGRCAHECASELLALLEKKP